VDGFTEMVQRLEPLVVLAYGRLPAACHELVEVVSYPTRWTNIRSARRDGVPGNRGEKLSSTLWHKPK
jgi:hypothetical protein